MQNLFSDSAPTFQITPLAMQTAYLRLLRQTMSVLREDQLIAHVPALANTLLTLLSTTHHCLSHRTQVLPHTLTPLKALRALCLTTLTHLLNTFPAIDLGELRERVLCVAVDPTVTTLPAESLQSCSPLLLLIESFCSHRLSWLQHSCQGKDVLEYVVTLLSGKGVVTVVIAKVLSVVGVLMDRGKPGLQLISPFIPQVVDYIHASLLSLRKVRKKGAGTTKKTLKQELQLLSSLSELITSFPRIEVASALVRTLLHVLKQAILRKPADLVNAVSTVTRLLLHIKQTESALYPELLTSSYHVTSSLLGSNNDKNTRLRLCALLTETGHESAGLVSKLHAWSTSVIEEPDFDLRLEGYRELGVLLEGTVSADKLTPCLQTALHTVFTSEEMALRDAASNSALLVITHVRAHPELYQPIISSCLCGFLQSGLRNPSEMFRREAIVLLQKVVQTFPEEGLWSALLPLTDEDPEIDFFNNFLHIQVI